MAKDAVKDRRERAEYLGPERRRPQVLDTALAIAAEYGVERVTMGTVAERLGVTRPVVYACYPGRGELLGALLEREARRLSTVLLEMLPPKRTGGIEQLFVDGFRVYLEAIADRPEAWRILFSNFGDRVMQVRYDEGRSQIAGQIAGNLRPLLVRWGVENIDAKLPILVDVFIASCETAARRLLDSGSPNAASELAQVIGSATYRMMRGA